MINIHVPNHRVGAFRALRDRARMCGAALASVGVDRIWDQASVRLGLIVGCGHSGTTLLASRLGLHRDVWLVDGESYALTPLHSARDCRRTCREWSAAAASRQRTVVLEKTPKHIHSLRRIERMAPGTRFLAMARDPLENIASMKRRYSSVDFAIDRYNLDTGAVAAAVESGAAMLIRYEELTREPEATLRRATSHLGLEWDVAVAAEEGSAYRQGQNLLRERLSQIAQPITDRGSRWRDVLTEAEAEEVLRRTAEVAGRLGFQP